jgi:hypothetical protein
MVDKLEDRDCDVIELVVSRSVEVVTDSVILVGFGDVVEMPLEAFQYGSLCLSNVLFVTCITLYAINQIVTFATDLCFCWVFPACGVASDCTGFVETWAVST